MKRKGITNRELRMEEILDREENGYELTQGEKIVKGMILKERAEIEKREVPYLSGEYSMTEEQALNAIRGALWNANNAEMEIRQENECSLEGWRWQDRMTGKEVNW